MMKYKKYAWYSLALIVTSVSLIGNVHAAQYMTKGKMKTICDQKLGIRVTDKPEQDVYRKPAFGLDNGLRNCEGQNLDAWEKHLETTIYTMRMASDYRGDFGANTIFITDSTPSSDDQERYTVNGKETFPKTITTGKKVDSVGGDGWYSMYSDESIAKMIVDKIKPT